MPTQTNNNLNSTEQDFANKVMVSSALTFAASLSYSAYVGSDILNQLVDAEVISKNSFYNMGFSLATLSVSLIAAASISFGINTDKNANLSKSEDLLNKVLLGAFVCSMAGMAYSAVQMSNSTDALIEAATMAVNGIIQIDSLKVPLALSVASGTVLALTKSSQSFAERIEQERESENAQVATL